MDIGHSCVLCKAPGTCKKYNLPNYQSRVVAPGKIQLLQQNNERSFIDK